jgi:hypothetical protein
MELESIEINDIHNGERYLQKWVLVFEGGQNNLYMSYIHKHHFQVF